MRRRTALAGLSAALFVDVRQAASQSNDPLMARSMPDDALVGPLSMVTILSGAADASRRFYQGAMDMGREAYALTGRQAKSLATSFELAESEQINLSIYSRPSLTQNVRVRVVEVDSSLNQARPNHDSEYLGPLSLGFPVHKIDARTQMLTAYGWPAIAGVTVLNLNRPDGSLYAIKEAHFRGPDGVLSLAIDRAEMQPVGPIDVALDMGGPSYSGLIVSDAKAMEVLLGSVLGFEKRRDVVMVSSGPNGGLGLPVGTRFVFQQWFAPGASTGYLVVMQYLNAGKPNPTSVSQATRGIARYSFPTKNLALVLTRVAQFGVTIAQPPMVHDAIGLGRVRSTILASAEGIKFEIFQKL